MRALEGQDMKSDLWKDKCKELFEICKDLERENDDLKLMVAEAHQAIVYKEDDQISEVVAGTKSTAPISMAARSLESGKTLGVPGGPHLKFKPKQIKSQQAYPSILQSGEGNARLHLKK